MCFFGGANGKQGSFVQQIEFFFCWENEQFYFIFKIGTKFANLDSTELDRDLLTKISLQYIFIESLWKT